METSQVRFIDSEGNALTGIMLDYGTHAQIICGCCGGVLDVAGGVGSIPDGPLEDGVCYVIEKFDSWVNFCREIDW